MEKMKEIDILDVLLILAKHKKFIFWTTLIVSLAAVVFSLVTPEYWTSTATILPVEDNAMGISSSVMNLGASLFDTAIKTPGSELVTIMTSRFFSKKIIDEFKLIEYFEINEKDSLKALDMAHELLITDLRNISYDDESGLVYISIETKNNFLSADIANYYWKELEKYNLNQRMSKGRNKRMFIERRVIGVKLDLDSLTVAYKKFQEKNNVLNIEEQVSANISAYSDLMSQKINNDIQLEIAKLSYDSSSIKVTQLNNIANLLQKKILEFESETGFDGIKYGIGLDRIPSISLEYAQLLLKLEITQKIYEFLIPQLEAARIEEIKDLPTIDVLDVAEPAGLRSRPERAKICILSFLIAFLLSSFLIYSKEILIRNGRDKIVNKLFRELLNRRS